MADDSLLLYQLLHSQHPAVFIRTFEEDEALQLIIDTALENNIELWFSVWKNVQSQLMPPADSLESMGPRC